MTVAAQIRAAKRAVAVVLGVLALVASAFGVTQELALSPSLRGGELWKLL